jgi:hypothetical protein
LSSLRSRLRAGIGYQVAVEHDQPAGKERLILLAIEDVAGQ